MEIDNDKIASVTGCYILDENNVPVKCNDFMEWSKWKFEHMEQCRVAYDYDEWCSVSTVFVGLCPPYFGKDQKLWESLVERPGRHSFTQRWSSLDEAKAGHAALCKQYLEEVK